MTPMGNSVVLYISKKFCIWSSIMGRKWKRRKCFPSLKTAFNLVKSTVSIHMACSYRQLNFNFIPVCEHDCLQVWWLPRYVFSPVPVSHPYFSQLFSFTQFVLQPNTCICSMFAVGDYEVDGILAFDARIFLVLK